MLKDGQIDRALAVHMDDVGLVGETVGDAADIADGHGAAVEHADRQIVEPLHRRGTGIELDVVFPVAKPSDAGRDDDVGGLEGVDDVRQ